MDQTTLLTATEQALPLSSSEPNLSLKPDSIIDDISPNVTFRNVKRKRSEDSGDSKMTDFMSNMTKLFHEFTLQQDEKYDKLLSVTNAIQDSCDQLAIKYVNLRAHVDKIESEHRENLAHITELKQKLDNMEQTSRSTYIEIRNLWTERMDALEARMSKLEANSKDKLDTKTLEEKIDHLQYELQEREQELLASDIEIAGIPETPGVGVTHLVLTAANKLGVQLEEKDIVHAERVGAPRALVEGGPAPRPRNIAVRVARRVTRNALLKAARVRRGATTADMGIAGQPCKFYVNERLTKLNRHLFQKSREIAGRLKWRFVWTREGRVFVRKENGSTRHRLRTEADLIKVFSSNNVSSEM
ncbi:uncharacterized protein LOC113505365 [Trichoplusia ni]|uniref:Uncharacterized protein LOC113505365 n=1 Tax=Trichoplusia ni TaxID=7111 RepID=A0A7E5WTC0_TRINI|nr:uncharacterized protein LOC113505365 [Trichoplusia ni]